MREYGIILYKTLTLGLLLFLPAAAAGWYFGGTRVLLGVAAGSAIAAANLAASLVIVSYACVADKASSLALVLSGLMTRLMLIALIFFLISKIPQINIFTVAVTLVVLYTVFAFSEFRFSTAAQRPQ